MHLLLGLFSALFAIGHLMRMDAHRGPIIDAVLACLWSLAAGANLAFAYAIYLQTLEDT